MFSPTLSESLRAVRCSVRNVRALRRSGGASLQDGGGGGPAGVEGEVGRWGRKGLWRGVDLGSPPAAHTHTHTYIYATAWKLRRHTSSVLPCSELQEHTEPPAHESGRPPPAAPAACRRRASRQATAAGSVGGPLCASEASPPRVVCSGTAAIDSDTRSTRRR